MNHRRALRASTDTGLAIFLVAIAGVVLWTADEVLNWNILPDWVDKYAQLLVMVLAIIAGFSVVISIMCSFAVIAESVAEKAGIMSPARSRRARGLIAFGILVAFAGMYGLHLIDRYRANEREQAEKKEEIAKLSQAQEELENRMPDIVKLFSPEIAQYLNAAATEQGDEAIARLLNAIQRSTPHKPEIRLLVRANAPYRYCVMTAPPEPSRSAPGKPWEDLKREFLTDLPSAWERETIESVFRGETPAIEKDQYGVFFSTREPSTWGSVSQDGTVVGIVMLAGEL